MSLVGARATARIRTSVAVGVLAFGAAGFSACGGAAQRSTGSAPVGTASFLPSGSLVYVEGSTDLASAQWQTALDLAKRFPGFDTFLAQAKTNMAKDGVDFVRDIRPLLGDSASLAVISIDPSKMNDPQARSSGAGAAGDHYVPPTVAAIDIAAGKDTAVEDFISSPKMANAKSAGTVDGITLYKDAKSSGDQAWFAVADGTLLVATSDAVIKQAIAAHRSDANMAKSERLRSVLQTLPSDTIAQGYVDFAGFMEIAKQSAPSATFKQFDSMGIGPNASVGLSLTAEQTGLRVKSIMTDIKNAGSGAQSFTPTFTANVPANALGMANMNNLYEMGRVAIQSMMAHDTQVKTQMLQAKGALALVGLSVDDLKVLFSGEAAVAVTPGATPGEPAIAGMLGTSDGAATTSILDRVRTSATQLAGGRVPKFTQVPLANGVAGWESKTDPQASIVYGVDGGRALFGSSVDAVRQMQAPKLALADDAAFKAATSQMPAKVTQLLWINGDTLWPVLRVAGAFKDAPAQAPANLRVLRNLAAWSTAGDAPTFEAFLTIG